MLSKEAMSTEGELFKALLDFAEVTPLLASTPETVTANLPKAREVVGQIAALGLSPGYADYFKASEERYAHYLAAAIGLFKPASNILDVGNAPGHVGIGLHLLGHKVRGLNMSAEYRSNYASPTWLTEFDIIETNFEHNPIPVPDQSYDAVMFTEVFEHIATRNPVEVLSELKRALRKDGLLIFSTPNVCNISNIYALLHGHNIFWDKEIFYGSLDRHNREFTPAEVQRCFAEAGFDVVEFWGMNDHSNWRGGGNVFAYDFTAKYGTDHPMLRNTTVAVYRKRDS